MATDTLRNPTHNELPKDRLVLCLAATDLVAAAEGLGETLTRGTYSQPVLACKQFDQVRVAHDAALPGASADEVNLAHVKAMIWAEQLEF